MNKYLSCILILVVAGCASMSNQQRLSTLEESTRSYGSAIRWNYFQIADSFRKEELITEQATDFSILKNLRVTSYEVLAKKVSSNNLKAVNTVEIKFYYIHNMIEKAITDIQEWLYDVDNKKWYLNGNLPDFDHNK